MDFTPELLSFQGALISADNAHNFDKITGRGGNEESILDIVTKLFNFLQESNYLTKNGITEPGKTQLRIYCFYLILNYDIPELEELNNMPGIESVVNTIPKINQHIICDIIWGLNMNEYLKEALIFSHPTIVTQLMKPFIAHLKYRPPTKCINYLSLLGSACYKFVCRLNFYDLSNDFLVKILKEVYDLFFMCMNYYYNPPNADKLNRLPEEEQYMYRGRYFYNLLLLIHECMEHFISSYKFKSEGFDEIYLLTIDPKIIKSTLISNKIFETENKLLLEYIIKFNEVLLDKCQDLVMDVSVQVFCAWTEFEDNGKTMQQTIRETCYLVETLLKKIPSVSEHPLLSMLPQMSCKPIDIHDTINSSDVNTIIENASKDSTDKKHWVKAIINIDNFMKTKDLLEILLANIDLLEISDCTKLFNLLSSALIENDHEFGNIIKCVAVKAFVKLPDETKAEFTHNHFSNNHFNDTLQCDDFHSMIIELFNKLCVSPNWNVNDVYNIFIQNPFEVILTVFRLAINSSRKCDVMLQILTMLKPFINHYYATDTDNTIVKAVLCTVHNGFETDSQIDNFIHFMTNLKKGNILGEAKLLMLIIMPELHKSLLKKDLRIIRLYVQLIKNGYELDEMLKYRAPLLAMIAQIMEVVRWTPETFVAEAPITLEESLELQIRLFSTYQSQIPEKEANWLRSKLKTLQPLNMYYYKELWNPPGDDFLEIISGGQKRNSNETVVLLAKVSCSLCAYEWASWWRSASMRGPLTALGVLTRALTLLAAVAGRTALVYAYSNFATLVKNNLLKEPLSDVYVQNVIEKIIILCNKLKEEDVDEVGQTFLPLISYIIERKHDYSVNITFIGNKFKHKSFADIVNQLFVNNSH